MFSFLSSALSGLSPYSISTALQRQVLGFLLRRTLGHLVKDGQLDPNQIETGIGSGKIDISDVELDPNSVNELLAHVPISLAHGVIGRVSVQLPFPNLFNGDLSITVSGLSLVCDMDEAAAAGASLSESVRDLAESIASAADEAVKEDPEGRSLEASLEQSLRIGEGPSGSQPAPPVQGGVIASIAASLLARLRIITQDVRVRIRVGGAAADDFDETPTEIELRLESLQASTVVKGGLSRPVDATSERREVTRTLELGGVSVWLLAPGKAQRSVDRPDARAQTGEDSEEDSSSDGSGDAYMEMSQAIPDLRATTDDLAQSNASMYASALDEASPVVAVEASLGFEERVDTPQMILTLGSEPLVVRYSMLQEVAAPIESGDYHDGDGVSTQARAAVLTSTSSLSVEVGTVTALLQLHQTMALTAAVGYLQSILSVTQNGRAPPAAETRHASPPLPFDRASVSVAAIHVICAYESSYGQSREALDASIAAYWAKPTKAHPNLGHLRLKVEQIRAGIEASERGSDVKPSTSLSIADVGVYEHLPFSLISAHEDIAAIVPVLIFDASLPEQYEMPASVQAKSIGAGANVGVETGRGPLLDQLAIDAVDWRRISGSVGVGTTGAGASGGPATPSTGAFADAGRHGPFWRTSFGERGWKVRPKHRRASSNLSAADQQKLKAASPPALSVASGGAEAQGTTIEVAPLHVFADVSIGARMMPLIVALSKGAADAHGGRHLASSRRSDLSSSIATLQAHTPSVPRPFDAAHSASGRTGPASSHKDVRVVAELVRLEVRAPACTYKQDDDEGRDTRRTVPRRANAGLHLRSGIAIIDLRGLDFQLSRLETPASASPTSPSRGVRFESERDLAEKGIDFGRISLQALVGFFKTPSSPAAVAFASFGKLSSSDEADNGMVDDETPPPLAPHLRLVEQAATAHGGAKRTFVDAHLPSLQVCLSKPLLDGLELLADDASQWASELARAVAEGEGSEANEGLKILGSRFFGSAGRASMSLLSGSSESTDIGATTTLAPPEAPSFALALSEADVCLRVPRIGGQASSTERLLAVTGSELHVFVEPQRSSNSTLVDLRILNVGLVDHSTALQPTKLLRRTLKPSPLGETHPMVRVHFVSLADADTSYKESRIDVLLQAFCLEPRLDASLLTDVGAFVASPEGAFEHVEPNEVTRISLRARDISVVAAPLGTKARVALLLGDVGVKTKLTPYAPRTTTRLSLYDALVMITDGGEGQAAEAAAGLSGGRIRTSQQHFASLGFVPLAKLVKLRGELTTSTLTLPEVDIKLADVGLELTACADTMSVLGEFADALSSPPAAASAATAPDNVSDDTISEVDADRTAAMLASVDNDAFRRASVDATSLPDLVDDDVPTDPRFLGTPGRPTMAPSPGVTLSELVEDDLLGLEMGEESVLSEGQGSFTPFPPGEGSAKAKRGQSVLLQDQSVKVTLLDPRGIKPRANYFPDPNLSPAPRDRRHDFASTLRVRVQDSDVTLRLFAGYDLFASRAAINDEAKKVRRRLQKIKQLLDEGQTPDNSVEEATGSLFDSMHVSLPEGAGGFDALGAMRAIDDELGDQSETASSASTWQPLPGGGGTSSSAARATRKRSKLHRSAYSWIDVELRGIRADYDVYSAESPTASRLNFASRSFEIIDNVKTSTWRTFLTEDTAVEASQRSKRMVRVEISTVRPGLGEQTSSTTTSCPPEEVRMRAKLAPLRLHVDQDALDFLKKFFAFKLPGSAPAPVEPGPPSGPFIQHAEILPIRIKLDYKPKRVNYNLLREGKTIELINFFHFDAAEMTLRHTTLRGVMGWSRVFEMLNDIWTPDVKANQLADVLSGIAPVRTLVNLGSGVADLVLLPIEQYQRDGKLVRGLQKGAMAFAKTTALEAVKLGARLANGTQVILEQAEHVLGGGGGAGQVGGVRGEALGVAVAGGGGASGTSSPRRTVRRGARRSGTAIGPQVADDDGEALSDDGQSFVAADDDEPADLISRYAAQPDDFRDGLQQAYKGLSKGLNDAAKTILAVPMEVYERGGGEAGSRPVVRAVPIAVLRGAAGASEAITKTLQGLQRELDPGAGASSEAKYKKAGASGSSQSQSAASPSTSPSQRSLTTGGRGALASSGGAGGSAAGGSSSRR